MKVNKNEFESNNFSVLFGSITLMQFPLICQYKLVPIEIWEVSKFQENLPLKAISSSSTSKPPHPRKIRLDPQKFDHYFAKVWTFTLFSLKLHNILPSTMAFWGDTIYEKKRASFTSSVNLGVSSFLAAATEKKNFD